MTTVRCPTCEAAYQIDTSAFPAAGRKLRCARCQSIWLVVPEVADIPAPVVVDDVRSPASDGEADVAVEFPVEAGIASAEEIVRREPTAEDDLPPPPSILMVAPDVSDMARIGGLRSRLSGSVWRVGALAMILLGVLAGVGVVIMKIVPGDTAHEATAHENVVAAPKVAKVVQPPEGLVLHRVRGEVTELEGEQGGVALTVRGLLANTTERDLVVPPMRLELMGDDGQVADMWPVSGVSGTLSARAENAWTVSMSAPDMSSVKGWRVVFVEDVPTGTMEDIAPGPGGEVSDTAVDAHGAQESSHGEPAAKSEVAH